MKMKFMNILKINRDKIKELNIQLNLIVKLQKMQGIGFQAFKILAKEEEEIKEKILEYENL